MADEFNQERPMPPTPAERNQHLANFYRESYQYLSPIKLPEIPKTDNLKDDIEGHLLVGEAIISRFEQEITEKLTAKLTQILATANVTQAMKDYIVWNFEARFFTGITPDREEELPEWVDSNSQKEGIFSQNKDSVKLIEQSTCRRALNDHIRYRQERSGLFEKQKQVAESLSKIGITLNTSDPMGNIPSRWKNEYLARYGDEP